MDFSPYQQLTGFLWYLIPLAVVGGLIKSPWFKGKVGEFLVNVSARLFLDKSRYHQMHSMVVFVGDSTFKTSMPENVTRGLGYVRYIKSKQEAVLTSVQVAEAVEKVASGRLKESISTDRAHVRHVTVVKEKTQ